MATKDVRITLLLTEDESKEVQRIRDEAEMMFEGISVSQSDAVRHLMHRKDASRARLWDVNPQVLHADVAQALQALGYDGDKITETILLLGKVREKARDLYLTEIGVDVSPPEDIR